MLNDVHTKEHFKLEVWQKCIHKITWSGEENNVNTLMIAVLLWSESDLCIHTERWSHDLYVSTVQLYQHHQQCGCMFVWRVLAAVLFFSRSSLCSSSSAPLSLWRKTFPRFLSSCHTANELCGSIQTVAAFFLCGKQFFQDDGPDCMSRPSGSLVKPCLNYKRNQ